MPITDWIFLQAVFEVYRQDCTAKNNYPNLQALEDFKKKYLEQIERLEPCSSK